jgi:hypothetical protein
MKYLYKLFMAAITAAFFMGGAQAQNAGTVTSHAFAIGKGAGVQGYKSLLCTSAQLAVGQSAADPICQTITGDATLSAAGALTFATVNANVGSFGSATNCPSFTVNAKGLVTAASATTCTPAIGSITGLGTGVSTALGVNVGSAGAFVTFNGALGTPLSGTATNLTGTAAGLTAGHVTTNANLTGDVTSVGNATTIAANAVTNAKMATMGAYSFKGNNTGSSATPTDVTIGGLTTKASPAGTDLIMISDQAASGAWKQATISSIASAGSVASIAGNTGAFTLSHGITNSTNDIQLNVGHLPGETSTGSAAAGEIGEYVFGQLLSSSAISNPTSGTSFNICSISLPAGDWDVSAIAWASAGGTASTTGWRSGISTTSASVPGLDGAAASNIPPTNDTVSATVMPTRLSLSTTTTVYLASTMTYTGNMSIWGSIRARRMR